MTTTFTTLSGLTRTQNLNGINLVRNTHPGVEEGLVLFNAYSSFIYINTREELQRIADVIYDKLEEGWGE